MRLCRLQHRFPTPMDRESRATNQRRVVQKCTSISKYEILKKILFTCFVPFYLHAANVAAGPADYVHTPTVEKGETEFGMKAGSLRTSPGTRDSAIAFGIGHALTKWWATELYLLYDRRNNEGTSLDAFEWENTFQLTPTGKYSFEAGFLTELERSRDHFEGYELVFGPLLQRDFGPLRANLNLLFSHEFGTEEKQSTQFGYQAQARYPFNRHFSMGLQAFGEMGKWSRWSSRDAQSHRLGPAVFGVVRLGEEYQLRYDAAILFEMAGITGGRTFRTALSYEF